MQDQLLRDALCEARQWLLTYHSMPFFEILRLKYYRQVSERVLKCRQLRQSVLQQLLYLQWLKHLELLKSSSIQEIRASFVCHYLNLLLLHKVSLPLVILFQ